MPELIPFDATARKALELSFRETLRHDHDDVGTGHVLLALLDAEDGGVLAELGVGKDEVDARVAAAGGRDAA